MNDDDNKLSFETGSGIAHGVSGEIIGGGGGGAGPKPSTVNHPPHYNQGKIEVIEFIEDKQLGFHLGNAVKYVARAGKKDPTKYVEDLEKAIWYIRREIELQTGTPRRPNDMNCRHLGKYSDGVCRDCGILVDCKHPYGHNGICGACGKLVNGGGYGSGWASSMVTKTDG